MRLDLSLMPYSTSSGDEAPIVANVRSRYARKRIDFCRSLDDCR